jgi:hypothetical protein
VQVGAIAQGEVVSLNEGNGERTHGKQEIEAAKKS